MEIKKAYLIKDITEYGKFISYCINNDITVWRTYWDNRYKGDRCYYIDWHEKKCYYASYNYYYCAQYKIVIPIFQIDKYGNYVIENEEDYK